MLYLMLLTPASARVSIQHVQIESRTTRNDVPSLPDDVNAVSLTTSSDKQSFHHVCRDIDVPLSDKTKVNPAAPWNEFRFFDCTRNDPWILDLKRHILLQSSDIHDNPTPTCLSSNGFVPLQPLKSNTSTASFSSTEPNTMNASMVAQPRTPHHPKITKQDSNPGFVRGHKRTTSSIPQFDQDADSIESIVLDESVESEIYDLVRELVDTICSEEDNNEAPRQVETAPGDSKQPLSDEPHSYMLLYAENPRAVDLGRAEKIFRIIGSLLHNDSAMSLGRLVVSTMLFTDLPKLSQSRANEQAAKQLQDAIARHIRHIHGEGFWTDEERSPLDDEERTARTRNQTFFEIFSTVGVSFLVNIR